MISYVTNLFSRRSSTPDLVGSDPRDLIDHTITEEAGEWLVISTSGEGEETDNRSVCSEGSWVITPTPRFRKTATPADTHSSLENLLIENPTMSIYKQRSNSAPSVSEHESQNNEDTNISQTERENRQMREYAIQRRNLAAQLGVPDEIKPPHLKPPNQIQRSNATRKILARQNRTHITVMRGRKAYKIKHCGVKAGRRRC